ncbi:YggT family protein [Staphylococcus pettenkoferi]|uniref:YggT family protein n=1 Tax=Staphylococcus pettenkoferi TaxID=170573 RepID=UPI00066D9D04|nr:YggT family protein [Staphylococcus pettenkoferi]MCI2802391.1 YggT family protein [Staphylococcus pettenkoferi]MCY1573667.1 YggT family protein [Staphylococcus pettenkoferi]MCY1577896.1 YggT family protein [Staphylococcus pettenkoferi]MCY1585770.1 YggT family protein [Staphylococcus pettenkoferi]MCY1615421.1 YggT family protein [Staphylococcus pettenkoferi]
MSLEILGTIFNIILILVRIYTFGMLFYFLMSWLPGARENGLGRFLAKIYEPFLEPFRRIIPPIGIIDISSIVALFVLFLFREGLGSLFSLIMHSL